MRWRVYKDGGFWLCFAVNLFFRLEWLVFAVIALVLNIYFGFPIIVFWILLGLWIGITFCITLLLSAAASSAKPSPPQENKNPYSAKKYGK